MKDLFYYTNLFPARISPHSTKSSLKHRYFISFFLKYRIQSPVQLSFLFLPLRYVCPSPNSEMSPSSLTCGTLLLHPKLYNNDYALAISSVLEIYLSFFPTITFTAFCFTLTSFRLSSRNFLRGCKFRFETMTYI